MGTGELLGKPNKLRGIEVTCDGLASRPGGVEILLAAACYGNRDKLWQHEPVFASRIHFTKLKMAVRNTKRGQDMRAHIQNTLLQA